ncbi:MAG: hypothetical protein H0U74_03340 [Bradymonadaceae bacterium]|nr:hypothetical protein [Lujinxingiaceae bacterium]
MLRSRSFKQAAGIAAAILGLAGASACERQLASPPEPAVLPPTAVEADVAVTPEIVESADAGRDAAAEPGPAPFVIESWPGREEMHTFSLTWLGGSDEIALRQHPDALSASVAEVSWPDGNEVEWKETRVVVTRPRIYRALRQTRFVGVFYDPLAEPIEPEEMVASEETLTIEAEERVALFQYAGEGACYVEVRERLYLGSCPAKQFAAESEPSVGRRKFQPLEQQWWVLVEHKKASGWVRVDESLFEVRTRILSEHE